MKKEAELNEVSTPKKNEPMVIKPHRGHTLFEVNLDTGAIEEAEFVEIEAIERGNVKGSKQVSRKKVNLKPGHFYVSALNKKNVIKKMKKQERLQNNLQHEYDKNNKDEKTI